MRAERDAMTGAHVGAAVLEGSSLRSSTLRSEVNQQRPDADPEAVAAPTWRQFTAEYRLWIFKEAD